MSSFGVLFLSARKFLVQSILCASLPIVASPAFADVLGPDIFRVGDKLDLDTVKERKKPVAGHDLAPLPDALGSDDEHLHGDDDAVDRYQKLRSMWTSDFVDTDFSKSDFTDLKNLEGLDLAVDEGFKKKLAGARKSRKEADFKSGVLDPDDLDDPDSLDVDTEFEHAELRDYKRKLKREDERKFKELTEGVPGMFHDWVPSDADRQQNGGFTIAPDNGSPVPYKLNGWIEIERKLPWEAEP